MTQTQTSAIPQIPQTIKDQIGGRCFMMLGASNLMYSTKEPNFLSFRIKGSPRVNYIKVTLDEARDTYVMEFGKIGRIDYKVVKVIEGVYCDMLHELIRENTGLATNL